LLLVFNTENPVVKLETKIGDIPAYGSIKEIVDAGIKFDTGVIYLPPTAVAAAAAELIAQNPDLKKSLF
jgi:CoA binding domain.